MTSPLESTDAGDQPEEAKGEEEETLGTQCTVESVGPCKRRLKAEVPSQKVEEELDRNYRELISTVQIPGFRRGHVPRRLIEKRYGGEIEGDVKEALLSLSFAEVVKEKELKVLGKPRFDNIAFQKGEPLRYEVEVEVRPEFELPAYTGIEVEGDELQKVKPEEVDLQVDRLREEFAELAAIDSAQAGDEDIFFGHYTLRRDGLRVHTREEVHFRPKNDNMDGFEIPGLWDKVSARGSSSSFTARVKVPPHYSEEVLRGSEVDLEFTIEETKRVQLPPADDDLAKRFDAPSMADLRSRIEKQIETRFRRAHEERLEKKALERVAEGIEFDLPEGLLEEQLKTQRLRAELSLIQEGIPREEIDAALKKVDEKGVGEEIRREFKQYFILEKIAEQEKIYATEDEINLQIAILAQAHRQPFKAVQEELEESGRMETLRAEIRHQKARRFLREKAKVSGAAPSLADGGAAGEGAAGGGTAAGEPTPPISGPTSGEGGGEPSPSGAAE